jgi:hypothetical protein
MSLRIKYLFLFALHIFLIGNFIDYQIFRIRLL